MKVLHLCAGNLYGGIETILATVARSPVPDTLHEFALCFPGRFLEELLQRGATVHRMPAVRVSRPWTVRAARAALTRCLRVQRYDVVVSHSNWTQGIFAPAVRRSAGTQLVFWMHGPASGRGWLERWSSRHRPDFVIANSNFTANSLSSLFPDCPFEVIHCPVEEPAARGDQRAAIRASLAVSPSECVIAQVSRLESWKGHSLLFDALHRMHESLPWVAWIVGGEQRPLETKYLASLRAQVERHGLRNRVRFLGQRSDIADLLAAADVHCQPNLGPEPFGITFIEAMYAGLPVVTTAMGGALEIVTAESGILVPPGDPAALARALEGLIADPARRAMLGAGGRVRADALCNPRRQMGRLSDLLGILSEPRA